MAAKVPVPGRLLPSARRAKQVVDSERRWRARRAPLRDDTVVYEAFGGNGMLCNPEAIFRSAHGAEDLHHLRHVWALADPDAYADTVAEFAGDPRVSFVRLGSQRYYRELATAKYLVNNATFPEPFTKRDGQIYLNTWHGTPIKAMGYDVPRGALAARNVVRNLAAADYLLAPNDETEAMYLSAYRMVNLFEGRLVRVGTPRIDRQFADPAARDLVRRRLAERGVRIPEGQQVLLYAPTWRGDFYRPDDNIAQLRQVAESVQARLARPDRLLLLKVHERTYDYARADPALRGILVPNELPANDLLAVTDVLITDYSSVWVDFLATGRPILFHAPDLSEYAATRRFNLLPEQWPGPISRDADELVAQLDQLDGAGPAPAHAAAYSAARERYCPHEDGKATQRVVDLLFRGRTEGYDVRPGSRDGRTAILIHLGSLQPNGVTSSALSLLANIDHDRFDVSAWFAETGDPGQLASADLIDPRVRLFVLPAWLTASKVRVRALVAAARRPGRGQRRLLRGCHALMHAEWTRAFGASRFAHVVDFSGYEPYWIKLLTARSSGSLSIWLHNEIAAEMSNRERAPRLRSRLRGAAGLYRAADHLVSVSQALNDVNRTQLSVWAPGERFTYARNTVDAERIRRLAQADAPGVRSGERTFVTVGRLSTEKNHLRLVRAFASVHEENSSCRLVIVGDGPLMARLRTEVAALGLDTAVDLAGHQANPYPLMARAGCFVLSSDYEGQPMVLLEALVLGLPIVTTRFGAVRDTLPEGCGLIVEPDVAGVADGMRSFLRGEVPHPPFDAARYNDAAITEFYRAIGAG